MLFFIVVVVVAEVEMRGWWGSEAGFVIACSAFPVVELRHFGISWRTAGFVHFWHSDINPEVIGMVSWILQRQRRVRAL